MEVSVVNFTEKDDEVGVISGVSLVIDGINYAADMIVRMFSRSNGEDR